MSAPELYGGIGSLVVGLIFVIFPKPIGIGFFRFGQLTWKGHENDLAGKIRQEMRKALPAYSPDYDKTKAPKIFQFLGVVFLIQAVVLFILSAVT
jgi:hypothetical protein